MHTSCMYSLFLTVSRKLQNQFFLRISIDKDWWLGEGGSMPQVPVIKPALSLQFCQNTTTKNNNQLLILLTMVPAVESNLLHGTDVPCFDKIKNLAKPAKFKKIVLHFKSII